MAREYSDFLMHHGVRGQRKGRRRYQHEDGSYTPEGRIHYGIGQKEQGSTDAMKRTGLTAKATNKPSPKSGKKRTVTEEEKQARRDRVKKVLGITAGIAVTAIVAHKVSKGLKNADRKYTEALERGIDPLRPFKKDLDRQRNMAYMVPKGAKIQRLSRFDESKAKGHAYVTFDPEDNARYKGFFGRILQGSAAVDKSLGRKKGTEVYLHDIEAREDLLSPDKRSRITTFLEMYKDHPSDIGKTLGNYHTKEFHDTGRLPKFVYRRQYSHLKGTNKITKGYRTFVKAIGDNKNSKLREEYFERLRKKGFNMIQDDQDSGRTGIRPSIVFDRAKSLKYNGKRELLGTEVRENLKKYGRRVARENRHREWN